MRSSFFNFQKKRERKGLQEAITSSYFSARKSFLCIRENVYFQR
nr:MAG TPA: hypothetical protein [Caudoviricetes sp.]